MDDEPLVSVGIPTYNRPAGLRRTLDCITTQTYRNLEIIISDNASPDPEVEQVAREFIQRDTRIHYYRQENNRGAEFNFLFVLKNTHGKYFMWAADDDRWEDFYIEKLTKFLESFSKNRFSAANFEVQYTDKDGELFEFFPEGVPFYDTQVTSKFERMQHMLKYNYGNLIYSLYRREDLIMDGLIFAHNEIPFLLQITQQGNWKVLPEIGLYKSTSLSTYNQARWEMEGGFIDASNKVNLKKCVRRFTSSLRYHESAIKNTISAIDTLMINQNERVLLKLFAILIVFYHLLELSAGFKKRISY